MVRNGMREENKRLRVAVIGVGTIGSAHARTIYNGEVIDTELSALCDIDLDKRELCRGQYPNIPVFASYKELICAGSTDAVIISTPHYFHPEIAVFAFEHGVHVLTEKPAGVYASSVREMIASSKKSGLVFGVMFNQRTNKLFSMAHELVRGGALGELKRAVWIITNWYRKQSYYDSGVWRGTWYAEGGGVLINQAPHNLDLLQWICGMPCSVSAECSVGKYHKIDVEDEAIIKARYKNGAVAMFITSTGDYPGTNRLEISGTKGKLVLEDGRMRLYSLTVDEREYCNSDGECENPVTVSEYLDEQYNGHLNILNNFARAVLYGEELTASGEDALAELEISNAAYLSAWQDREIALPADSELFENLLKERAEAEVRKERASVSGAPAGIYLGRWNTKW